MSLAPIQKLIPDSIRSRKMIEGVFPIFSRNAFFDVSKSAKHKEQNFALEVPKLPEGALQPHLRGECFRTKLELNPTVAQQKVAQQLNSTIQQLSWATLNPTLQQLS